MEVWEMKDWPLWLRILHHLGFIFMATQWPYIVGKRKREQQEEQLQKSKEYPHQQLQQRY